jgi:glycosyltransferase involved in cell wall biosynthesis
MRILQAIAGRPQGGAENFFIRLAVALNQTGVHQKILIRHHQDRAAQLRHAGLAPLELRFGGIFDFASRHHFRKAIQEYRPSIVCTWMSRATALCPPGSPGQPFIHVGRLGGYYNLKYYRHCDHLVGNTQDIVDYILSEGWPRDRVHYLPNFVDATPGQEIPRSEFGIAPETTILLALGRLHENKAMDIAISALPALPDCHLLIAGEGPLREALVRQVQDLGIENRVSFLGWRDDTADLLATCDIFLCPSRHEPLGNVILEAFAQSKPVIAAASTGPSSLINHGENGLLFSIDDKDALTQAINRMRQEPDFKRTFGSAGHASYRAQFTQKVVLRQWLEFFSSITVKG